MDGERDPRKLEPAWLSASSARPRRERIGLSRRFATAPRTRSRGWRRRWCCGTRRAVGKWVRRKEEMLEPDDVLMGQEMPVGSRDPAAAGADSWLAWNVQQEDG